MIKHQEPALPKQEKPSKETITFHYRPLKSGKNIPVYDWAVSRYA
jgi:hypothetical protein